MYSSNHPFISAPLPQELTEASADVDVEVDAVVTVVHQITVAHFDQRAEVVLLTVRVKRITGHLDTEERASYCSTHIFTYLCKTSTHKTV